MRNRRYQNHGQLVLELERQHPQAPAIPKLKGLVEALADILLEALNADRPAKMGGADEHEDHA